MAQLARLAGSKTRNGTRTEKLTRRLGSLEFHARENRIDFLLRTSFIRRDNNQSLQIIVTIVL